MVSPAHIWVLGDFHEPSRVSCSPASSASFLHADSQHRQADVVLLALAAHCQRLVPWSTAGAQACAAKGRGDSAQPSMDEQQLLLLAQRCFWEFSRAPAAVRQSGVAGRALDHLTEVA